MRARKLEETLDMVIERKDEISALEKGKNLSCMFHFYSSKEPKTKLILKCREEARENPDQLLFPWFDDYKKTQFLTEPGYWIETVPKKVSFREIDPLTDEIPEQQPYETILVTISKKRLTQLTNGECEDDCLLTRCIFDRMQIRYYDLNSTP